MSYDIPLKALQRPIAYHRIFREVSGSTVAALFLSQMWYWTPRAGRSDGWIYKTREELQAETGLSRSEQETARKHLKARGILKEELRGVPARMHYRIDGAKLSALIRAALDDGEGPEPTSWPEGGQPDGDNVANWQAETLPTIPETTAETTTERDIPTDDAVKPATSEDRLLARFDRFWQVYPRKVGKQAALREWKKIKPDDGMTDRMIAAVEVHKGTEQWRKDGGQYIPHPRTWLHQGRWDDVPQVELAPPTPRNRKVDTLPDFDPVAFLAREYMTMDEGQVERYRAGEPLEDVLDEHQWQHLRDELVRRGARVDMLRSAPNFV